MVFGKDTTSIQRGMLGKHHSEETKELIGSKSKGRTGWLKDKKMPEYMKNKIKNSLKEKYSKQPIHFKGKKLPQSQIKKIGEANRREKNSNWKNGRNIRHGYIYINIGKNHPLAQKDGYVAEHRLVMSNHLDRPLKRWEYVHHRNGKREDNRLSNLQLVLNNKHRGEIKCPFCQKTFAIH